MRPVSIEALEICCNGHCDCQGSYTRRKRDMVPAGRNAILIDHANQISGWNTGLFEDLGK